MVLYDENPLFSKAMKDLRAVRALNYQDPDLTGIMGLHIQQFVEKIIKTKLDEMGVFYHKTHDLYELLALLGDEDILEEYEDVMIVLTQYAVRVRYEGREPDIGTIRVLYAKAIGLSGRLFPEVDFPLLDDVY